MEMQKREIRRLLGSDLAQRDKHFLHYVVQRNDLLEELIDPENGLVIINSPRGSGKSGLLLSHEKALSEYSYNYITIRKFYEDVKFPDEAGALPKHFNFWLNSILGWIFSIIGSSKGIAISDDEIRAAECAESEPDYELNSICSVLKRLKITSSPIERTEFDPKLEEPVLKRIIKNSDKTYWVLLDEMDDLYSNSIDRNHSLVALFQVSSYLTSHFDNIKIRITIRPHIYTFIKTNFDGIQKLRECVVSISWTEDQLRAILARRIEFFDYGTANKQHDQLDLLDCRTPSEEEKDCELISRYFDDFDMAFREGKGSSYRAFHTVSMERPRWMIEFCKIALSQRPSSGKASTNCFKLAFAEYGQNRVDFISGEYKEMYPFLSAAINSIASARRVKIGSSKELRSLIKGRVINTNIVSAPKDAGDDELSQLALEIAKALYVVEFIRAKQSAGGTGRDHRHYTYSSRSSLLDSWNKEPNIEWEIHPTFARALNIEDSQVYIKGGQARNFKKESDR